MQKKTDTTAEDMDQPEPRGHGCGVTLVAFAIAAGVALRRTRLEEGLFVLDVWQPEKGGWEPMRQELHVTESPAPGGGVLYTERVAYPAPFARLVEDDHAWSPKLPADVMVDVLTAQVERVRARAAKLEKQVDEERARWVTEKNAFRDALDRLEEVGKERDAARAEVARLTRDLELANDADKVSTRLKLDAEALAEKHERESKEWEARYLHVSSTLASARKHLRDAHVSAARLSRTRDAERAKYLARELRDFLECATRGLYEESKPR